MKQKSLVESLLFLGLIIAQNLVYGQPPIGDEGFAVIQEIYTYDKSLLLDPIIVSKTQHETYTQEKLYYTGVKERVSAYLAIPHKAQLSTGQREESFPVVLLIDGMGGSKDRWFKSGNWPNGLETVEALVDKGFAVFTIDAALHGERFDPARVFPEPLSLRKQDLMHTVRDMIAETTKDYMRGLDYLETRDDIDISNIGVYGLSMGGAIAFILTGLDERIKTAVTGVAVVYGKQYSIVNAKNFTTRITNRPFLMLMGDSDGYYTPETATKLFNTIGGDANKLIIFKGGHKIPASYVPIIVGWFETALIQLDK